MLQESYERKENMTADKKKQKKRKVRQAELECDGVGEETGQVFPLRLQSSCGQVGDSECPVSRGSI